jgi:hypothetical protein
MTKGTLDNRTIESLMTDDSFMEKIRNSPKGSGLHVQVKLGKGITKNDDPPVNGKIPVYLDSGQKVLCSINKIYVTGFYD